jgi:hypothetical protein
MPDTPEYPVVIGEVQQYRAEMMVPRVARAGTTWRTLAVKGSYSEVGDLADYLVGSMTLAGIDRELARTWVAGQLRCVPETVTTAKQEPEAMPYSP